MKNTKYILGKNGQPRPERNLLKWSDWMEIPQNRMLWSTTVGNKRVSTVFLGLDYNFGPGDPILFETMVFSTKLSTYPTPVGNKPWKFHKPFDQYTQRYETREQAEKGHKKVVAKIKRLAKKK